MNRMSTFCSLLSRTTRDLEIVRNADLTERTTMKMAARCGALAHVRSPLALRNVVVEARERGLPSFVLGKGANTIFAQTHFDGVVITLGGEFMSLENLGDNLLYAGAGVSIGDLLDFVRKSGLMGIEFLTGVPGTVGGALAGNAGAGNWGLCDLVESVIVMTRDGHFLKIGRLGFRYRYRHSELRDTIVLGAELRLWPLNKAESQRRAKEYMAKKKGQPYKENSSGCVFKNPKDPVTGLATSAGKLIDSSGLKGYRIRSAFISEKHANFMVNRGHSSGEDFLALISLARDIVHGTTGIELSLEAQIVGGPLNSVVLA